MKNIIKNLLFVLLVFPMVAQAGNIMVPYVGTITDEGELYEGEASFKVALCTESDVTLWSNDGTSTSCSEPSDSVAITLTSGVYSFMLGDTDLNMTAMASSVLDTSERIYLRTWFDGGDGFELFDPDIEIGYALRAGYADTLQGYIPSDFLMAADEIEADNIADSAITAAKISDGAVTAAKISTFSNSGKTFTLGDASDANVSLVANLGATSPAIRYNVSADQWEISNDGSSYSAIGTGSGGSGDIESVTAGTGLTGGGTSGAVTVNVAAGTGLSVAADSIGFDFSGTISGNPALNAGEAIFGTTGIIFEAGTADTNELLLVPGTISSDVTITLPTTSGTVLTTGSTSFLDPTMISSMYTLSLNSMNSGQVFFDYASNSINGGILWEGATSDGNDALLSVTDPTADRTWVLPDASGTVLLDNMSGDATITSGGVLTVANNSVDGTDIALGSDTQGDIMYYNGTDWARLAVGSNGQVLTVGTGSPTWATPSSGVATSDTPTWTGAHTFTFGGTESISITSDLATTGTVDVLSVIASPSGTNGSTTGLIVEQANSTQTNGLDVAFELSNADTDLAMPTGMLFSSDGGAITTAIDASATAVGTALSVGDNSISGTTLTLTGSSAVDIQIPDNVATAFSIRQGTSYYLVASTTDSEEALYVGNPSGGGSPYLLPGTEDSAALGYTTKEWNTIYLGDDAGVQMGNDQDAHLYYDETTNDRVELRGANASLYLEDMLTLGRQSDSGADGGVGGPPSSITITPTSSYVEETCADADGCLATLSETGAKEGQTLTIVNVGSTILYMSDSSGVQEIIGGVLMQQGDSISFIYDGSAWIQTAASANGMNFIATGNGGTLGNAHHKSIISNEGVTSIATYNLPTLDGNNKGIIITFVVQDTDGININPDGSDRIFLLTNNDGDSVQNSTQGSSIILMGMDSTNWIQIGGEGTWSDAN